MEEPENTIPAFLPKQVDFPGGAVYELLSPLTNYKINHDGTPTEAATVVSCRRIKDGSSPEIDASDKTYIMKIKVQMPEFSYDAEPKLKPGPSTTSQAEVKALTIFKTAESPHAPHLVTWKQAVQDENGPLAGGYITYIVMTMMAGRSLHQLQFWSLSREEKEEITQEFLKALRSIRALGIRPIDNGLRNAMWDKQSKTCSIIDFEVWRETKDTIEDDGVELVNWGLAQPRVTRDFINGYFNIFNAASR